MKKFFYIASACILMAGCSTLSQGWKNFNAYYNTFYNTKQFYGDGLEKIKLQQPDINPAQLITIFYEPNNAGSQDFETAIERGSSILRSHENSKYVFPAISIIGKSYFYRSEFFAALEKFRELQILGDEIWMQEAVFWEGLTYFELGNYEQGIRFLENELYTMDHPDRNLFAEIHALLGQLYSASGEWNLAAEHLQAAVEEAESRETRARIYFLLGQVNEEAGEYSNALYAFSRSGEISNSFNLQYNSLRKEAESARRIEAFPRAQAIYTEMLRDDKFFEYRNELRYEIGRTLQSFGMIDDALENYHSVLSNQVHPATATNRAKTFFAIAEIQRYDLHDYTMAAAYFDSAASAGGSADLLGASFNADEMADIFGRYVLTKREISSADSLLQLAEMDEEEFEAFVEELRREEAQRIEDELQEIQSQRNQMLVADVQDTVLEAATSTEHGFLNINNQVNLADASMQFQAIWGDRPLGDNWRRRSAISGSRFDRPVETETADGTLLQMEASQEYGIVPQIDVGEVPFTEEQKEVVRKDRENAYYRLGNVLFLSLNEPDSASTYFQHVVESGYNEQLKGMATYSLAEISLLNEDHERAIHWYEHLKEQNPNSVYVNRLADRLDATGEAAYNFSADDRIIQEYVRLEERRRDHENVTPQDVSDLAQLSSNPDQRALLLFETAREYMKAARFEFTNEAIITSWFERTQGEGSAESDLPDSLNTLQSPAIPVLQDSILTNDGGYEDAQASDTTRTQGLIVSDFPFEGAYWDSTRLYLSDVIENYPDAAVTDQAVRLYSLLEMPGEEEESLSPEFQTDGEFTGADEIGWQSPENLDLTNRAAMPHCSDLGLDIGSEGGLSGFMDRVTFPEWTENLSMRGEVIYHFTVLPDGTLAGFEQSGSMERSGIPQAIEVALEESFYFAPNVLAETAECSFVFPIDL